LAGRVTNHEDFGTQDSYNIDYRWNATASLSVSAGIGKGFRAPNASERFGYAGNPRLEPETSVNMELGLKLKVDSHQVGRISFFQNKIKNLINYYDADGYLGPQPGQMQNIDRARIRGAEFSYSYQQHPYTFSLEGLFQTPQDEENKQLLLRRAKRSLTSRFSYTKNASTYGVEAMYSSFRQDINDFGQRVDLAGYGVVNLFLTDKLDDDWNLNLKIDNMFNRQYQLASGYNTQGLLALIELRYSAHDL
jgi:vitamin B12 transporter